jgi:hypothetical protein
MNKTELLIVGQDRTGFEKFRDLVRKRGDWNIIMAGNDEEAIEKFYRHDFEVVVFTDVISSDEERKLRKIFTFHNPDIIIVKDQHDNKGVVVTEIMAALDQLHMAKKPSFSLVDDALINAGLKINIQ